MLTVFSGASQVPVVLTKSIEEYSRNGPISPSQGADHLFPLVWTSKGVVWPKGCCSHTLFKASSIAVSSTLFNGSGEAGGIDSHHNGW